MEVTVSVHDHNHLKLSHPIVSGTSSFVSHSLGVLVFVICYKIVCEDLYGNWLVLVTCY